MVSVVGLRLGFAFVGLLLDGRLKLDVPFGR